MSDLGQLLQKARTERGLSLEDVAEFTKIQKRYLEAIETGNFKILPGNFYVRAFIKTYAEAVGLEPNEVLRLYRNVIPAADTEQHIEPIRRRRESINPKKAEKVGKWASGILMWSFVILILGIIYYFINVTYEGQEKGQVSPNDRLTQQMPSAQNQNAAELLDTRETVPGDTPKAVVDKEIPPAPKPVVAFIKTENSTYLYTVSNTDAVQVDMKIIGDRCWLQAKVSDSDGEVTNSKEYQNGDTPSWSTKDSISLRLGKPLAVEVKINGTLITIPETVNPINIQVKLEAV